MQDLGAGFRYLFHANSIHTLKRGVQGLTVMRSAFSKGRPCLKTRESMQAPEGRCHRCQTLKDGSEGANPSLRLHVLNGQTNGRRQA
jgi:hypothetical protein